METQKDIIFTYDDLDQLWRMSLGEHADISAVFYKDNYGESLEQTQRDKNEWIIKGFYSVVTKKTIADFCKDCEELCF